MKQSKGALYSQTFSNSTEEQLMEVLIPQVVNLERMKERV